MTTAGGSAPNCPRCGNGPDVHTTVYISAGSYYVCRQCQYMWRVEEAARAAEEAQFSPREHAFLRRLRRRLGLPLPPTVH